jgi:16S rRNA (guanine527-N7)-methyltransferase
MHRPTEKTSRAATVEELARRLETLGFPLREESLVPLAAYLSLLMRWNAAMNLVGAASWEEALETLILDSFHLAPFLAALDLGPEPFCLDIGSGAGLPGIPLRLLWRKGTYVLVEAREKRALFMRTALAGMALGDTRVFQGRAEAYFKTARPADLIVSRAFMPWRGMLDFVAQAHAPEGRVVFLTQAPAPDAVPNLWRLEASQPYPINGKNRYFWCFAKDAP